MLCILLCHTSCSACLHYSHTVTDLYRLNRTGNKASIQICFALILIVYIVIKYFYEVCTHCSGLMMTKEQGIAVGNYLCSLCILISLSSFYNQTGSSRISAWIHLIFQLELQCADEALFTFVFSVNSI